MSDTLVRTVGTAGRDLYESMLNYGLVRTTRRRRYRSSSSYLSSPSWSSGVSSSSGSTAPRSHSRRRTPSGFFNAHGDNFIFYNKGYDDHIHTLCPGGESIDRPLHENLSFASPRPRRSPSLAACAVGLLLYRTKK
jgi:hypothetical protein